MQRDRRIKELWLVSMVRAGFQAIPLSYQSYAISGVAAAMNHNIGLKVEYDQRYAQVIEKADVCMYVCMSVCLHVCMSVRMRIHMYM